MVGTEIFEGSFEDLNKFVPTMITRKQVVSKYSAVFDILGKLTPVTAKMKVDVRTAVKETEGWDDAVSAPTRDKWVDNLWRLYKLQGLKFSRARIPVDAANTKLHLVCSVDASDQLKVVGVLARFKRVGGDYSC